MAEPQKHRNWNVRKLLTLEERVRAIQAYDHCHVYNTVAKLFNCSWEQIKNIIANRDSILKLFDVTKKAHQRINSAEFSSKINFLGKCLFEYIQRVQFYTNTDITEELLRTKTLEFRDLIHIENFVPNKEWINHFKEASKITHTRAPPSSLDSKHILIYCSKNKEKLDASQIQSKPPSLNTTRIAENSADYEALQEMKYRRERKINFFEKVLFEYCNRLKYRNILFLNDNSLQKVAFNLKEILNIDNFHPDNKWFNKFVKMTYPILKKQLPSNTPPQSLSLDLKDIVSYCSRLANKKQAPSTVTVASKETPPMLCNVPSASKPTLTPIVELHTLNLQRDESTNGQKHFLQDHHSQMQNQQTTIKEEITRQERKRKLENAAEILNEPPPLKIRQIEKINKDAVALLPSLEVFKVEVINKEGMAASVALPTSTAPSLAQDNCSVHNEQNEEQLPMGVRSYSDVLKLLRPLEEFAMLEDNYRIIGLLAQVENLFKNLFKHRKEG